ncbi:hypothetical protein ACVWXQ_003600 [Bradyrhizobium sp. S3.14.4]
MIDGGIVDVRADAGRPEMIERPASIHLELIKVEADYIQVVGVRSVCMFRERTHERDFRKHLVVAGRNGATSIQP